MPWHWDDDLFGEGKEENVEKSLEEVGDYVQSKSSGLIGI